MTQNSQCLWRCKLWLHNFRNFIEFRLKLQLVFMVTPCISDIKHFIVQLMHITLKNVELLEHF
jgi:hypothetical protein